MELKHISQVLVVELYPSVVRGGSETNAVPFGAGNLVLVEFLA